MNEQHKLNRLKNRAKRIARRIAGLHASKLTEINRAQKENREPDLSPMLSQIRRLEVRANQLN